MQSGKSLICIEDSLKKEKFYFILKRIFDIIFSVIGLLFLCPLLIIIAILIKIDSRGPAFFKQTRIGLKGKEFYIYKFRTMVNNAEKIGKKITVSNDKRITKIGKLLRKYKFDELPQLINVLKDDMSLVGPRPEVPKYVELYDDVQKQILLVKPGITDYASIEFRKESEILAQNKDPEQMYINEIMPYKISLNFKYIQNLSLKTDVLLILKTVIAIIN